MTGTFTGIGIIFFVDFNFWIPSNLLSRVPSLQLGLLIEHSAETTTAFPRVTILFRVLDIWLEYGGMGSENNFKNERQ